MAGSTPLDQGLHVDICLSEILININPSTIELISKCYDTLLSDSVANAKSMQEPDYSDLWEPQSFNAEDYWFLKTGELKILKRCKFARN